MSNWSRLSLHAALLAAAALPGLVWACALPAPDGPHPVGVQRFELTDRSRQGVAGDEPGAERTLPAHVWYPSVQAGERPYLSAGEAEIQMPALARNLRYDPESVARLGECVAHSQEEGVPLRTGQRFPLVVLSHGFFLYPAQNTALAERLASHGYVVVAIAHPRDSVDVELGDGRVVATNLAPDTGALQEWRAAFHGASTHEVRAALLDGYAQALAGSRLGASQAAWRDDMLLAVRALQARDVPDGIRPVLETTDPARLALAGMSFGGSTAATACRRVPTCRAAISLDGLNFDPDLFDADLERPLLLLLSDWIRFPLYDGLPSEADFNPNDYAYERREQVGLLPEVVRLRVPGTRHMSFSDLPLLMRGPENVERFGDADATEVAQAVGAVTLAFLDTHLKIGEASHLQAVIDAADLVRHDPIATRQWAGSRRGPAGIQEATHRRSGPRFRTSSAAADHEDTP